MKGKSEICSTYLHTYLIIYCMYVNRWNTFCSSPSYRINSSKEYSTQEKNVCFFKVFKVARKKCITTVKPKIKKMRLKKCKWPWWISTTKSSTFDFNQRVVLNNSYCNCFHLMCRDEKSTSYIFKKERCSRDTPCECSCKYLEKKTLSFSTRLHKFFPVQYFYCWETCKNRTRELLARIVARL